MHDKAYYKLLGLVALVVLALATMFTRTQVNVHIVVSRYAEDVAWLRAMPGTEVTIYDKGGPGNELAHVPANARRVPLPNVGREGHTYLHHIITQYDNLADVTVFLPASCAESPDKWKKALWVVARAFAADSAFPLHAQGPVPINVAMRDFAMHTYKSTHAGNALKNPESDLLPSPDRPFGAWYAKKGLPEVNEWCSQGIFAVSRRHVHQRSLSQYRTLMQGLDTHSNPEAGHFMERAWMAVFAPVPPHCTGTV